MCRFFGNIGNQIIEQSLFEKLTLISKKGGPDSTTFYQNDIVQFGFNRLAILDTSEKGNQPFTTSDGRFTLMLNGEVYNYLELKSKYQLYNLKSASDAEVVLHLIEKISFPAALVELNGMFAISCWDALEKKLYLARDFAGIKPLFYSVTSNGMVFGSQFDQILKHPWCQSWSFSDVGLSEYLQFGYMPAPHTIAQNVYQLNVGEYLVYSLESQIVIKKSYSTFFNNSGYTPDDKADVSDVINNAVKRQMVSDVPLGVFLSGGIDSALVAAKAIQYKSDISAITIGFENPQYDESSKAISYAKHLGIKNHHVERFGNQQLFDLFENHFEQMSEPIADYSCLPTYLVSQISRKSNTVMLSGDGGDELFWGYPRFLTFANSAKYFQIPGRTNRKIAKRLLKSLNMDITGFLSEESLGDANLSFHSYMNSNLINDLTGNYTLSNDTIRGFSFKLFDKRQTLDYVRKNEFYFHLQKILVKVDRMSMANSLEVRVPLLDKEVIRFSENIYSGLSSSHHDLKKVLKEELYKYIPKDLVEKKKRGFTPPLLEWSKNELKSEIFQTLNYSEKFNLNQSCINKLLLGYYQHENISFASIWSIFTLIKWLKVNP
jgi:asparagine synthase (glutamine-hydrolysing)